MTMTEQVRKGGAMEVVGGWGMMDGMRRLGRIARVLQCDDDDDDDYDPMFQLRDYALPSFCLVYR